MLIFFRYWWPACAYAGVIFYLSSLSHPEEHLPIVGRFSDKVLHAVEYAVLGALCFRAFQGTHQSFVPFRYSHVLDWVADTIGAILGVLAMHRAANFRPANSIPEAWP